MEGRLVGRVAYITEAVEPWRDWGDMAEDEGLRE
jgi:hypothetical protein